MKQVTQWCPDKDDIVVGTNSNYLHSIWLGAWAIGAQILETAFLRLLLPFVMGMGMLAMLMIAGFIQGALSCFQYAVHGFLGNLDVDTADEENVNAQLAALFGKRSEGGLQGVEQGDKVDGAE